MEYLSQPEIEDQVKELLWSYRQFYLPQVETDETSAADYNQYMRKSEQAWWALEAAFKHHAQWRKELLQDMSDGADIKLQTQLIAWSREINWPESEEPGFWRSTAQDAAESRQKTNLFLQDRYWPFTKVIRCAAV